MRYFLAGGAIRDILLGIAPREFDIAFSAPSGEFLRLHKDARTVGKTTVTYIVDGREHTPLVNGSIAQDLAGRDLTINALLMDAHGVIHALPETFADLRDGIIRPASPDSFIRDPVRVFRAARLFAALSEFSLASETPNMMRIASAKPAFTTIAPERVGRECMKAMVAPAPGNFLRALAESESLAPWLSPLDAARAVAAGPEAFHGQASVFDHTCAVMDAVAAMPYARALPEKQRALAVWMALCHDLGKTLTPASLLPRHIGHETRGVPLANTLAQRLRLPKTWHKAGALAALLHMKGARYTSLRPGTRVDLLNALHASGLFAPFRALVMADSGDASLAESMLRDMRAMLAVTLPESWRNKGKISAAHLRELRAQALPR